MKIALAALALLLLTARGVRLQAMPQSDAPPRPEPILDNSEFMTLLQKPAYVDLQEALAAPPADRRAWALVYQRAARLAEMQNLLFIRNRPGTSDPRWAQAIASTRRAAADVADAALAGLRSAEQADYDGVRKKYSLIAATCNNCHRAFSREAPTIKP